MAYNNLLVNTSGSAVECIDSSFSLGSCPGTLPIGFNKSYISSLDPVHATGITGWNPAYMVLLIDTGTSSTGDSNYSGGAPDVHAYEEGGTYWVPGCLFEGCGTQNSVASATYSAATPGIINHITPFYWNTGRVLHYRDVNFGGGADLIEFWAATPQNANMAVYIDNPNGTAVASGTVLNTGAWYNHTKQQMALNTWVKGIHDVYLKTTSGDIQLLKFNFARKAIAERYPLDHTEAASGALSYLSSSSQDLVMPANSWIKVGRVSTEQQNLYKFCAWVKGFSGGNASIYVAIDDPNGFAWGPFSVTGNNTWGYPCWNFGPPYYYGTRDIFIKVTGNTVALGAYKFSW